MSESIAISKRSIKMLAGFSIAVAAFYSVLKVSDTNAQSSSSASMPSSGTCSWLVTLPVPYAATSNLAETGYNFLGQITFTSSTTGTFNAIGINPTYQTGNSPYIAAGSTEYFNNWTVAITPMTANNGFVGAYKLTISGSLSGGLTTFEFNAVPANGGKTILLQSSSEGTAQSPGIGPASGVCQI